MISAEKEQNATDLSHRSSHSALFSMFLISATTKVVLEEVDLNSRELVRQPSSRALSEIKQALSDVGSSSNIPNHT